MNILEIKNVEKFFYSKSVFGKKVLNILRGLSLSVGKGEIYGLLGPNGVGKTTLIDCIMGFLDVQLGQISFFGGRKISQGILNKIGYLPEQTKYFDYMTGWEMIMFTGKLSKISKNKLTYKAVNLLKEVGLFFAKDVQISKYSTGMQRRLGIILSLLHDPDFLIRDEPMSGLDPLGRIVVRNIMKKLKDQGKTILFSTHILHDAEQICDRVGILFDGRIIYENKISNLEISLENIFKEKILYKVSSIK